jgi:hypothetical protein|nr:MAG TPA: hypothetical protein [Caudoviricetes sp.]
MDAVEFFKTVNRLCKNQRHCTECPICKNGVSCMVKADDDSIKSMEETVSKVEQWAKDHPVKTRQSEFLKMFPNANTIDGVLIICPMAIDKALDDPKRCCETTCQKCLEKYWLAPINESEE